MLCSINHSFHHSLSCTPSTFISLASAYYQSASWWGGSVPGLCIASKQAPVKSLPVTNNGRKKSTALTGKYRQIAAWSRSALKARKDTSQLNRGLGKITTSTFYETVMKMILTDKRTSQGTCKNDDCRHRSEFIHVDHGKNGRKELISCSNEIQTRGR